jgi:undecaprenyl-diphosphatase
LLFLADRAENTHKNVTFGNSFVIGIAQAVAMLPGISRSGATIATSVLLGIDKRKAARFSFLMVVPLILGKIAKDFLGGELNFQSENFTALGVGFVAAFVAGLLACTWMIRLVRNSRLTVFAVYCLVVGLLAIAAGVWWL